MNKVVDDVNISLRIARGVRIPSFINRRPSERAPTRRYKEPLSMIRNDINISKLIEAVVRLVCDKI